MTSPAAEATPPARPPVADRRPVTTEHHGRARTDEYDWLRAKDTPEVTAYLEAENAWTAAATDHLAGLRDAIFGEIKSRTKESDLSVPTRNRGYWYYGRSFEGREYGTSCRVNVLDATDWTPPMPDEDAGPDHFLNAEVIVSPEGEVVSRYDKVRRVPFGEYMPLRSFLAALGAPTNLVPRDAVAGTGPAVLTLPDGTKLGVVISWEVFFGGRANEGVEHGGTFILNPTNGSSYTWTVLQSQQIASSRLRAVEQGRWVAQAAPTGFSAFVDPGGGVHDRTSISAEAIIARTVTTATDRTWYSHLGTVAIVVLAVIVNVVAVAGKKKAWRRSATPA